MFGSVGIRITIMITINGSINKVFRNSRLCNTVGKSQVGSQKNKLKTQRSTYPNWNIGVIIMIYTPPFSVLFLTRSCLGVFMSFLNV